jgi:hypothetical protein
MRRTAQACSRKRLPLIRVQILIHWSKVVLNCDLRTFFQFRSTRMGISAQLPHVWTSSSCWANLSSGATGPAIRSSLSTKHARTNGCCSIARHSPFIHLQKVKATSCSSSYNVDEASHLHHQSNSGHVSFIRESPGMCWVSACMATCL